MRFLVLAALVGATTPAYADLDAARNDIVDIRHGRMPSRSMALGWTKQGAFVFRRTSCGVQDLSDIPDCVVVIDVAQRGRTESHVLFSSVWEIGCVESAPDPPDPKLGCWKISTEAASGFLAAERALRAELGPLTAGTPGATLPAGTIAGVRYEDARGDRRRAAIVLANGGRWRPLRVIWSVDTGKDEFLRDDPVIEHVEQSPDGESLAVVTALAHAEDDFFWQTFGVDVLPLPRASASAP